MKRCPECRRDYYDETLLYCLEDGAALVSGVPDEPATAILTSNRLSNEQASKLFDQPPATDGKSFLRPVHAASKRKSVIAGVAGIIIVTALGIGSYLYYGQPSNKQIESIAVMPFVNGTGNADLEYLSDGMTETLISHLSQLPN
ncbi:MAG: hypothetical protein LC730_00970, partial [Acidobacteria bacterium]|nr:hypothetical protein [Acidobacteriota bacterium]MCA1608019.1 hypothetical protein [Acidobacteriota bacterium]